MHFKAQEPKPGRRFVLKGPSQGLDMLYLLTSLRATSMNLIHFNELCVRLQFINESLPSFVFLP